MKGEIVRTQFNFEVKYLEDGVRKYLTVHPDTDITKLEIGMEVEFEPVTVLREGVTYSSQEGWNRDPVLGIFARIIDEWELIEQEYMKDEYPTFGGPFTNALTPWEWLKLYYKAPKRKDEL